MSRCCRRPDHRGNSRTRPSRKCPGPLRKRRYRHGKECWQAPVAVRSRSGGVSRRRRDAIPIPGLDNPRQARSEPEKDHPGCHRRDFNCDNAVRLVVDPVHPDPAMEPRRFQRIRISTALVSAMTRIRRRRSSERAGMKEATVKVTVPSLLSRSGWPSESNTIPRTS